MVDVSERQRIHACARDIERTTDGSACSIAATVRFQPWRQDEAFAKPRRIFVDREARAVGCELEQHSAGLLEVDRLEPETIDDRRRMRSCALDTRPDGLLMLGVIDTPCKMVNGAHTPRATSRFRRIANVDDSRAASNP